MAWYNWLSLFGVPAISFAVICYLVKKIKLLKEQNEAVKLGVQALLRDRLYQLYEYCKAKGFATISERENFMNMYNKYHSLGQNGVMDDTKDKFLALPVK